MAESTFCPSCGKRRGTNRRCSTCRQLRTRIALLLGGAGLIVVGFCVVAILFIVRPTGSPKIVERSVERIVEKPIDRIVEKPVVVQKVVEKPVDRVIERIVEKPVEKIVERIVERPIYIPATAPTTQASLGLRNSLMVEITLPNDRPGLRIDLGGLTTMDFVHIEPGEFIMGSPENEPNREPNRTKGERQHKVKLTKPFYMGIYEVTQEQYQAVMGVNPSKFKGEKNLPVEQVSWNDAVKFCRKLSQERGKTYRLPTEAEWEYACRAGTTGVYGGSGKLDDMAWYRDNSGERTHPVGQKQPNAWGLYDMHGNVWEWCSDFFSDPTGSVTDPRGPVSGSLHAVRGGSFNNGVQHCREALRDPQLPTTSEDQSFRVAMDLR